MENGGLEGMMLACNSLRIDPVDGSSVIEYRIEDSFVEACVLQAENTLATGKSWHRLTPEQLTSHVMTNTVVAYWLRRRMGVHWLCEPVPRTCLRRTMRQKGQTPSRHEAISASSEQGYEDLKAELKTRQQANPLMDVSLIAH